MDKKEANMGCLRKRKNRTFLPFLLMPNFSFTFSINILLPTAIDSDQIGSRFDSLSLTLASTQV
jgi:hypothetical protein